MGKIQQEYFTFQPGRAGVRQSLIDAPAVALFLQYPRPALTQASSKLDFT
jgi:hypothetical protein